jgi:putative resolvase
MFGPVEAARAGHRVVRIESELASGMDGGRAGACRLLADPEVTVVVEHRDRLGRVNVKLVEGAVLSVAGRCLVVLEDGEADVGLVGDVVEVLTSFWDGRYGRGSVKHRAARALEATADD